MNEGEGMSRTCLQPLSPGLASIPALMRARAPGGRGRGAACLVPLTPGTCGGLGVKAKPGQQISPSSLGSSWRQKQRLSKGHAFALRGSVIPISPLEPPQVTPERP